jgi:hypothetical protein
MYLKENAYHCWNATTTWSNLSAVSTSAGKFVCVWQAFIADHQPSLLNTSLIRFQLSRILTLFFFTNLIVILCCTCVLCSLPTVFASPVLSPLTPCERTWPDRPHVVTGMQLQNSLSAIRYVTSQQKPAVQGDEVGHESGLPPPEGYNGPNKESTCGQSPGDTPEQPACQTESFHEVKMVNCL